MGMVVLCAGVAAAVAAVPAAAAAVTPHSGDESFIGPTDDCRLTAGLLRYVCGVD